MIDLAEWEEDLARLHVTQAPHRMGGRVVWIASRPDEASEVATTATGEASTLCALA